MVVAALGGRLRGGRGDRRCGARAGRLAVGLAAALIAGCGSSPGATTTHHPTAIATLTPTRLPLDLPMAVTSPTAAAVRTVPGRPRPPVAASAVPAPSGTAHVMVIMMENHSVDQIIGSSQAPYVNGLAASYGLATNWSDLSHPSLPNYLGYISGSTWGNPADTTPQDATYGGASLTDELSAAGRSWKAYMEDMPTTCDLTDQYGPGNYDVNHNPFMYFTRTRNNPSQCNRDVPYPQLHSDLANNTVPDFAWVSPNTLHDMHDGSIQAGDQWLQGMLPSVLASNWYRAGGVVILTWDEGETTEQVATIVISARTHQGARVTTHGTEYGTLRTIEQLFGVPFLGASADAANGDLQSLLR
jgi:phosphatidylinositol-3-phosphatase